LAIFKALQQSDRPYDANAYYRALGAVIDVGARVVNLSLGGAFDRGENDIIDDLLDAGIVVVAAMGNEYQHGNPATYPAAYDGVIAVGAVDEADRRAPFSCTGAHLALMAPGTNILSTVPRYPTVFSTEILYDSLNGTSMAAPYVSAAAALVLAQHPDYTPNDVRECLVQSADAITWAAVNPSSEYGAGRLNIFQALQ
jgi:subtilisin family serine protease